MVHVALRQFLDARPQPAHAQRLEPVRADVPVDRVVGCIHLDQGADRHGDRLAVLRLRAERGPRRIDPDIGAPGYRHHVLMPGDGIEWRVFGMLDAVHRRCAAQHRGGGVEPLVVGVGARIGEDAGRGLDIHAWSPHVPRARYSAHQNVDASLDVDVDSSSGGGPRDNLGAHPEPDSACGVRLAADPDRRTGGQADNTGCPPVPLA
ncbi:hypothetical protein FAGKG844_490016 [Frankia sp. AgKG'84/4]